MFDSQGMCQRAVKSEDPGRIRRSARGMRSSGTVRVAGRGAEIDQVRAELMNLRRSRRIGSAT
jgi:hypothetical protein